MKSVEVDRIALHRESKAGVLGVVVDGFTVADRALHAVFHLRTPATETVLTSWTLTDLGPKKDQSAVVARAERKPKEPAATIEATFSPVDGVRAGSYRVSLAVGGALVASRTFKVDEPADLISRRLDRALLFWTVILFAPAFLVFCSLLPAFFLGWRPSMRSFLAMIHRWNGRIFANETLRTSPRASLERMHRQALRATLLLPVFAVVASVLWWPLALAALVAGLAASLVMSATGAQLLERKRNFDAARTPLPCALIAVERNGQPARLAAREPAFFEMEKRSLEIVSFDEDFPVSLRSDVCARAVLTCVSTTTSTKTEWEALAQAVAPRGDGGLFKAVVIVIPHGAQLPEERVWFLRTGKEVSAVVEVVAAARDEILMDHTLVRFEARALAIQTLRRELGLAAVGVEGLADFLGAAVAARLVAAVRAEHAIDRVHASLDFWEALQEPRRKSSPRQLSLFSRESSDWAQVHTPVSSVPLLELVSELGISFERTGNGRVSLGTLWRVIQQVRNLLRHSTLTHAVATGIDIALLHGVLVAAWMQALNEDFDDNLLPPRTESQREYATAAMRQFVSDVPDAMRWFITRAATGAEDRGGDALARELALRSQHATERPLIVLLVCCKPTDLAARMLAESFRLDVAKAFRSEIAARFGAVDAIVFADPLLERLDEDLRAEAIRAIDVIVFAGEVGSGGSEENWLALAQTLRATTSPMTLVVRLAQGAQTGDAAALAALRACWARYRGPFRLIESPDAGIDDLRPLAARRRRVCALYGALLGTERAIKSPPTLPAPLDKLFSRAIAAVTPIEHILVALNLAEAIVRRHALALLALVDGTEGLPSIPELQQDVALGTCVALLRARLSSPRTPADMRSAWTEAAIAREDVALHETYQRLFGKESALKRVRCSLLDMAQMLTEFRNQIAHGGEWVLSGEDAAELEGPVLEAVLILAARVETKTSLRVTHHPRSTLSSHRLVVVVGEDEAQSVPAWPFFGARDGEPVFLDSFRDGKPRFVDYVGGEGFVPSRIVLDESATAVEPPAILVADTGAAVLGRTHVARYSPLKKLHVPGIVLAACAGADLCAGVGLILLWVLVELVRDSGPLEAMAEGQVTADGTMGVLLVRIVVIYLLARLVPSLVTVVGALGMRKGRWRRLAMASCVLSMLPGTGWPLTLILGLSTFGQLRLPEVRAAFDRSKLVRTVRRRCPSGSMPARSARHLFVE